MREKRIRDERYGDFEVKVSINFMTRVSASGCSRESRALCIFDPSFYQSIVVAACDV